jgi:hypothetical protein
MQNPICLHGNHSFNLPPRSTKCPLVKKYFFKAKPTANAATVALVERADLELNINTDLVERRRFGRAIPTPEAIEHDDEETWSTWNELATQQEQEAVSATAVAKLRLLLHRKAGGGEAS